ncbi:hypothetical protein ACTXT7_012825, partial [Hymenolepis weldensis]
MGEGQSQPSTLKNGQPTTSGAALMMGDRSTLPLVAPQNPPFINTFHTSASGSNNGAIPTLSGGSSSDGMDGSHPQQQQLMNQQYYQEHIQRLERELEAVRRQVSKTADASQVKLEKRAIESCVANRIDALNTELYSAVEA